MELTDPARVVVRCVDFHLVRVEHRRQHLQTLLHKFSAGLIVCDINAIKQVVSVPAQGPDRLLEADVLHVDIDLLGEFLRVSKLLLTG